jgi:hypothetical protein
VGIDGTFTHRLAVLVPAFQLSIQYGINVIPSLAVNRTSLPLLFAFPNANELPNGTFTSKFVSAPPVPFVTVTATRYVHAELSQDVAPELPTVSVAVWFAPP